MTMFLLLLIAVLGILLLGIVVLMRYVLLVVTVENISMSPTLEPGDRVLMARYWPVRWLRKGHIVLIDPWREAPPFAATLYIKRIAALGGETLTTSYNDITPNIYPSELKLGNGQNHWYIPAGHFFALGDNPRSVDSRRLGPFPLQKVHAVALMKLHRKARPHPT